MNNEEYWTHVTTLSYSIIAESLGCYNALQTKKSSQSFPPSWLRCEEMVEQMLKSNDTNTNTLKKNPTEIIEELRHSGLNAATIKRRDKKFFLTIKDWAMQILRVAYWARGDKAVEEDIFRHHQVLDAFLDTVRSHLLRMGGYWEAASKASPWEGTKVRKDRQQARRERLRTIWDKCGQKYTAKFQEECNKDKALKALGTLQWATIEKIYLPELPGYKRKKSL